MARDEIVWGILGTAKINDKVVIPMHSAPKCRVKGIASRSQEKARATQDLAPNKSSEKV